MDNVERLAEVNDEALYPTGFEDAIIGYVERFGLPPLALVDRMKCIEILMSRDGMSGEDAEEFFEFNIIGSWMGEHTPCFATIFTE